MLVVGFVHNKMFACDLGKRNRIVIRRCTYVLSLELCKLQRLCLCTLYIANSDKRGEVIT